MEELTREERSALASCVGYLLEEDHDSPYDDWLEGHIGYVEEGRDEFMLVVAPLPVKGGTGSPVNPLAVF